MHYWRLLTLCVARYSPLFYLIQINQIKNKTEWENLTKKLEAFFYKNDHLSESAVSISYILTLYEEVRVTEDIEQAYTKKTVTDNTMAYNTTKVTQTGITGLERVTQEIRIINFGNTAITQKKFIPCPLCGIS